MADDEKKFSKQILGKTVVSKTGKRFGEVGDIVFETSSGELIHIVLKAPTPYTEKLELEKQISALPPVVLGGLIVVPIGLVAGMTGTALPNSLQGGDKQASAARARAAVMEVERGLGFEPTDRELERLGFDIESRDLKMGKLRFLEVKGRISGADAVTVTRNEILYPLKATHMIMNRSICEPTKWSFHPGKHARA